MPAATKNLTFEQYAAFKMRLIWLDKNKKPVNLTGYTAKMQVRNAPGGTVLLDSNTTNGHIVLGTINGVIDFNIPEPVISALNFETAVYDVVLTPASGGPVRFIKGKVTLSPGVTQNA